jgi:TetR/AcrR family transcriptional repressor of nem operon
MLVSMETQMPMHSQTKKPNARGKVLAAALKVIREKGYTATSVDDLCKEAGVTKGAFFHHFKSKEDLAVQAAQYWSDVTGELFAHAPYQSEKDPLAWLLGYVDFRKQLLRGDVPEFTCLVGTMVQEAYDSNPAIRKACEKSIFGHAATLISHIAQAQELYGLPKGVTPESLALHTQAVIQGAYILAKSKNEAAIAVESIEHLHRYIRFLFTKKGE